MKSKLDRASFIILGISAAFVLIVTYWSVWPYQPVVLKSSTFPVLNPGKIVRQGEPLYLDVEFTRNKAGPVLLSRRLRNGIIYNMQDVTLDRAAGHYRVVSTTTRIPDELPDGIYTLDVAYTTEVNPIRSVTVRASSEPFQVAHYAPVTTGVSPVLPKRKL